MIRIGIIGAGLIGHVHAASIAQLITADVVDADLAVVHDSDPVRAAALAATVGAQTADSPEQLLDAVDAVWICTWTDGHRALVEAAASRAMPTFCEKPLAPTWPEAIAVAEALVTVPHRVGLVLRTSPVFVHLKEELTSQRHGSPLATVFRDDQYFPIRGFYGSTWRRDATRAGGGTLLEHSIHDVDLLRWFLGDPCSVSASIGYHFGHQGIDDTASVRFEYDLPHGRGRCAASLASVWHDVDDRVASRHLEVLCERGCLRADDDRLGPLHIDTGATTEIRAGSLPHWVDPSAPATTHGDITVSHYGVPNAEFLGDLAAGAELRGPGAHEALAAHRLVEAAYRSAASGGAPIVPETIEPGSALLKPPRGLVDETRAR